jgi:hypothetical protein
MEPNTFPILSLTTRGSERLAISRTETFVITLPVVASNLQGNLTGADSIVLYTEGFMPIIPAPI